MFKWGKKYENRSAVISNQKTGNFAVQKPKNRSQK